jgi:alpha-tubulin suppressor-like RCC1 family protein
MIFISPASVPCVVEDLLELPTGPITKISSGGCMTAALTAGNDMYVWGGRPAQPQVFGKFSGPPTPVDLDVHDVLDIAVGDNHMLALTTDRTLFVVGANGNGQLGLGIGEINDWKQVSLPLTSGAQIMSVYAGYKNSFVVVGGVT